MFKIVIKKSLESDWQTPSFPRSSMVYADLIEKAEELKVLYDQVGIKNVDSGEVFEIE